MSEAIIDLAHLQGWQGRSETVTDQITAQLLRGFRAVLDIDPGTPVAGEIVPQALHWCLSPPTVPMHEIGPDGHPARGGFLPPVPLPRRMWAGGRLTFHDALRVGDAIERISTVEKVTMKEGRTGLLCFVLVSHRLSTERGVAIEEEHDIVYRGLDAPAVGARPMADGMGRIDASQEIEPSPVLLFRYSALTFNGHRIHYDRDYVTKVEGYPGLIVHGPLQATMLMQLAARMNGETPVRTFSFKAVSPLFDTTRFSLNGRMDDSYAASLWVAGAGGALHMEAKAGW